MTIRSSGRVRFGIASVGRALAAVSVSAPATVRRTRGGIRWFPLPQIMTSDPPTIQHMPDLIASFPGYGGYPDNNRPLQPLGSRIVEGRVG
jgi:hypothetical protein